jgi:hypothetical protein
MKKNYVLIGAGFVAPRHYKAIKETGGNLLARSTNVSIDFASAKILIMLWFAVPTIFTTRTAFGRWGAVSALFVKNPWFSIHET